MTTFQAMSTPIAPEMEALETTRLVSRLLSQARGAGRENAWDTKSRISPCDTKPQPSLQDISLESVSRYLFCVSGIYISETGYPPGRKTNTRDFDPPIHTECHSIDLPGPLRNPYPNIQIFGRKRGAASLKSLRHCPRALSSLSLLAQSHTRLSLDLVPCRFRVR